MNYILKGNLHGFYCGDCYDYLYRVKVKIYAIDKQTDITALAVAREKETFHQRSDEELKSLSKRLLFETETDEAEPTSTQMQCLICGEVRPAIKRLQFKIKRIPGGQSAGMALISANATAFESYGLEASLIAPTCQDCGERSKLRTRLRRPGIL